MGHDENLPSNCTSFGLQCRMMFISLFARGIREVLLIISHSDILTFPTIAKVFHGAHATVDLRTVHLLENFQQKLAIDKSTGSGRNPQRKLFLLTTSMPSTNNVRKPTPRVRIMMNLRIDNAGFAERIRQVQSPKTLRPLPNNLKKLILNWRSTRQS